jgi:MerR family transcriptional regulator, light-induced transcriptional regulator
VSDCGATLTSPAVYRLDDAGVAAFMALRDEAIAHTLAASERAFPEVYARFGPRGRQACEEDLGYHLDFLRPTLETNDLAPFLAYLGWLTQVLTSRGVPMNSVTQSMHDLADFFAARLGAAGLPVAAALHAGREALAQGIPAPAYDRPCPTPCGESMPYAGAAVIGQREHAAALLDAALARDESLTQVAVHAIQPAMYEVGRLWQDNSVSVAQEQLATAMSQSWMARARARARSKPDNGRRALFACLPGNRHVMGLRMVADAFELDGWTTYGLGADTGDVDLVARVEATRPHLVGFSASLPQHLRDIREGIRTLRGALGDDCPRLVVGGLVINQFPALAAWLDAEVLGADAASAVSAAEQVFGRLEARS